MLEAVLSTAVSAALLLTLFGAAALGTSRLWVGRPYLGIAYGTAGVGLASMVAFVATWIHPSFGVLACAVMVAGCLVFLGSARVWRYWRVALPLASIIGGLLLAYLGLVYIWTAPQTDFFAVIHHFSDINPAPDSFIPMIFSDDVANGVSTHMLISDWNGSDRPPLQSGFILIARLFAAGDGGSVSSAFGASLAVQMLWLPALFAFLRSLGIRRMPILFGLLLAAVAGTTFFNTVYTWPKLFSAALVFAALAFLVDAIRRPRHFRADFVAAVLAFVLAVLAHGVAAFIAPVLIGLGIAAYRAQPWRRWLGTTAVAGGAAILLYLPWLLYQMLADPPGDRLLKWHLAGVISAADHRPFLPTLISSYRNLSLGQWVHNKVANITQVFQFNPFLDATGLHARRVAELQLTTIALGIAFPMAILIAVYLVVKRVRKRPTAHDDRVFWFMVAASLVCIVFWCLAMFRPYSTIIQQGSQVWIFLLLIAPEVWLAARHSRLAAAVILIQLVETLLVYVPPASASDNHLNPVALAVGIVGVAAVASGCWLYRRHEARLVSRPLSGLMITVHSA